MDDNNNNNNNNYKLQQMIGCSGKLGKISKAETVMDDVKRKLTNERRKRNIGQTLGINLMSILNMICNSFMII